MSRITAAFTVIKFAWELFKLVKIWQKNHKRAALYREISDVLRIENEEERHKELRKRIKGILD